LSVDVFIEVRNYTRTFVSAPFIILLLLAVFCCGSNAYAQNKLPEGFELQSSGRIIAPDSLLPEYYLSYALGGQFRKGIKVAPESYNNLSRLLPIPILVGTGISYDQSVEMYIRAVKFHVTGKDPAGTDGNGTGRGNIEMPNWIREYLSEDISIERLYKEQWGCGNAIIVDTDTKMPLLISNSYVSSNDEFGKYYNCLYGWAAAYPWFFYELPNIALRESLAKRDLSVIELFAKQRFMLSNIAFEEMLNSQSIPNLLN
jgi:hypothetical protein